MQAINYTTARNNLKTLIDEVCDNSEEVIITTKNYTDPHINCTVYNTDYTGVRVWNMKRHRLSG